ncbi:MAG: tRNA pseudouridine(38-40) synthase TruA [bacterium]
MAAEKVNVHLVVQYDGSGFHGFQKQAGVRTVQGELERGLGELLGQGVELSASSRTDAGVHAMGQSVSFRVARGGLPPERIAPAAARFLPEDILAVSSREAPPEFHARHSATGKEYMYLCYRSAHTTLPVLRRNALRVPEKLDVGAMRKGAGHFAGTHDFSSFAGKDDAERDPVKTIFGFGVSEWRRFIVFRVRGSGFLYRMVRAMVGTLLEVGAGSRGADGIPETLAARSRGAAGRTAGPEGLYLMRVFYEEPVSGEGLEGLENIF